MKLICCCSSYSSVFNSPSFRFILPRSAGDVRPSLPVSAVLVIHSEKLPHFVRIQRRLPPSHHHFHQAKQLTAARGNSILELEGCKMSRDFILNIFYLPRAPRGHEFFQLYLCVLPPSIQSGLRRLKLAERKEENSKDCQPDERRWTRLRAKHPRAPVEL